jgi:hypothetical protein
MEGVRCFAQLITVTQMSHTDVCVTVISCSNQWAPSMVVCVVDIGSLRARRADGQFGVTVNELPKSRDPPSLSVWLIQGLTPLIWSRLEVFCLRSYVILVRSTHLPRRLPCLRFSLDIHPRVALGRQATTKARSPPPPLSSRT